MAPGHVWRPERSVQRVSLICLDEEYRMLE